MLAAGFPVDAARAAYEALACAIGGLLDEPAQPGDGALVEAVYREPSPAGRLPSAAPLAMLHDLSSLDAQGVAVDADLAAHAVSEAEQWLERPGSLTAHHPPSNSERGKAAGVLAPAPADR
ncbi:MAG TPA: hypothetical protein VF989_06030 [Polyangiaceae bacterium]